MISHLKSKLHINGISTLDKFICECGKTLQTRFKESHLQTKEHTKNIEKKDKKGRENDDKTA